MCNSKISSRLRFMVLAAVAVLSISLNGCSGSTKARPKVVPVNGVVKFKGKPVVGADITFMAEGSPRFATAKTDAEGKYSLTTFDTNDGAVAGKHTVTIAMSTGVAGGKKPEEMKPEDLIAMGPRNNVDAVLPVKYASPKESGLVRTVVDGEQNTFSFDLD